MRLKPSHIYLVLIAVLVSVTYSFAQEAGSPVLEGMESEKQSNNGGEIIIYTDGEGSAQRVQTTTMSPPSAPNSTQSTATSPRESSSNSKTTTGQAKPKSAQQKQAEEEEAKPEDSVLGFNFLYYIFQKYKMSDIVD